MFCVLYVLCVSLYFCVFGVCIFGGLYVYVCVCPLYLISEHVGVGSCSEPLSGEGGDIEPTRELVEEPWVACGGGDNIGNARRDHDDHFDGINNKIFKWCAV